MKQADKQALSNWIPLEAVPSFGEGRSFVAGEPDGDRFRVRYFQHKATHILGGLVWFGPSTEGGPHVAHGGAVSAILDEAMGRAAWLAGHACVTASLSVNYRRPVALRSTARVQAWVESVEGRKVQARGRLLAADGSLLADGSALFIRVADEHFHGRARELVAKLSSHFGVEPVVPVPAKPESIEFRGCDGIRLVADTWGRPEWPPVIFLHGGGQTRHSWGGTARAMAEHGWYAVTLDARGHGDSDWSREGHYEATHFAADVAEVVRALGRPPVLVGASLGGMTSLVAVGEGLLKARALVLVDITPKIEREGVDRILAFMQANLDGFDNVEQAADAVAAYRRHRSRPKDVSGLRKNLRLRNGRYFWHWDPVFMSRPRDTDEQREARLRAAARRIRVPALLVRGHSSDVVSAEGVRQFLEDVPHARCIDVNGAGHMVAGDRNDVFTEAVMGFLEETLPAAR